MYYIAKYRDLSKVDFLLLLYIRIGPDLWLAIYRGITRSKVYIKVFLKAKMIRTIFGKDSTLYN